MAAHTAGKRAAGLAAWLAGAACLGPAHADQPLPAPVPPSVRPSLPPLVLGLHYWGDILGVVGGGKQRGISYLDRTVVSADLDLGRTLGWTGATMHIDVMSNLGRNPSNRAGSLLGIDGNEVAGNRVRLPQAWIQQSAWDGRASLLVGYYDTSAEFNASGASSLLIGRTSGVSVELNASGINGPAAFPETALAARLKVQPTSWSYAQAVVADGRASALGDAQGPNFHFGRGLLTMAELGYQGNGTLAIGVWDYTRRQPDLLAGPAVLKPARGAYAIAEHALHDPADGLRKLTAFIKAGLSDRDTTPFAGSWDAGLLLEHLLAARPDSAASIGVSQGRLTRAYRGSGGPAPIGPAETDVELIVSDSVAPHLKLQPDLQFVHRPSGTRAIPDAWVIGLRIAVAL